MALMELGRFGDAEVVWVQDEPANMGPWPFMSQHLPDLLGDQGIIVARRTIAKYREALSIPPVNMRRAP